jgi:hypothetical protein
MEEQHIEIGVEQGSGFFDVQGIETRTAFNPWAMDPKSWEILMNKKCQRKYAPAFALNSDAMGSVGSQFQKKYKPAELEAFITKLGQKRGDPPQWVKKLTETGEFITRYFQVGTENPELAAQMIKCFVRAFWMPCNRQKFWDLVNGKTIEFFVSQRFKTALVKIYKRLLRHVTNDERFEVYLAALSGCTAPSEVDEALSKVGDIPLEVFDLLLLGGIYWFYGKELGERDAVKNGPARVEYYYVIGNKKGPPVNLLACFDGLHEEDRWGSKGVRPDGFDQYGNHVTSDFHESKKISKAGAGNIGSPLDMGQFDDDEE